MNVPPGAVVWSDGFLRYAWSPHHPMNPARLELTMALARELGVLDGAEQVAPRPAADADLLRVHDPSYIAAIRRAEDLPEDEARAVGLDADDNPVFAHMHEAAAIVVGGTLAAAEEIVTGRARRAVSIGGGMHHAMAGRAAGFCVYNDVAVAISWLLDNGFRRIAYIDVDVHHGDGVQAAFEEDPRVLTVSIHQDPATLWPCTGGAGEIGTGPGTGTAVNLPLPPGTGDAQWLRAFHAVVPEAIAAFAPEIIVSQCGVDTHRDDPLADLRLTVDGQRAAFVAMRDLADRHAGGRWLAVGGGGYDVLGVVPRAWTHLMAAALGRSVAPDTPVPAAWRERVRALDPEAAVPLSMGDGGTAEYVPWPRPAAGAEAVDRAVRATRRAVFGHLGLDPEAGDD